MTRGGEGGVEIVRWAERLPHHHLQVPNSWSRAEKIETELEKSESSVCDASDGRKAVASRNLAGNMTVPGLIVLDPADELVRRVDGAGGVSERPRMR